MPSKGRNIGIPSSMSIGIPVYRRYTNFGILVYCWYTGWYTGGMKVIKITDELHERLSEMKGEETFSSFIGKLLAENKLPEKDDDFLPKPMFPPNIEVSSEVSDDVDIPVNENGDFDFDLHNQCCIDFIKSECKKRCPHWKIKQKPWGELYFINNITHKLSNEYDEDGTWNPY